MCTLGRRFDTRQAIGGDRGHIAACSRTESDTERPTAGCGTANQLVIRGRPEHDFVAILRRGRPRPALLTASLRAAPSAPLFFAGSLTDVRRAAVFRDLGRRVRRGRLPSVQCDDIGSSGAGHQHGLAVDTERDAAMGRRAELAPRAGSQTSSAPRRAQCRADQTRWSTASRRGECAEPPPIVAVQHEVTRAGLARVGLSAAGSSLTVT